jgi:hypothetical protein
MNRDTESVVALTPNITLGISLPSTHNLEWQHAFEAAVGHPQTERNANQHHDCFFHFVVSHFCCGQAASGSMPRSIFAMRSAWR